MGSLEDLDEAIECARETLTFRPPGHPDHWRSLLDLSTYLKSRFRQTGNKDDVDEAIKCDRACLTPSQPHQPTVSKDLVTGLVAQFKQAGLSKSCYSAVHELSSSKISDNPSPGSDRLETSGNFDSASTERMDRIKTLEAKIERLRKLKLVLDLDDPRQVALSSSLFNALIDRAEETNLEVHRQEVAEFSRDPLGNTVHLAEAVHLASILDPSSNRWDKSVERGRRALATPSQNHHAQSVRLNDLAIDLLRRFRQKNQLRYLDEAIKHLLAAQALQPQNHPDRHATFNNLAAAMRMRYEQSHREDDLEEAIKCNRAALAMVPEGNPNRAGSLNNLSSALQTRFEESGRMDDLDEAVGHNRAALALRPQGHPERLSSLGAMAVVLQTRFGQSGRMVELDEAIEHNRAALALRPHGHENLPFIVSNLAVALRTRFKHSKRAHDLDEAIEYHRAVLALFLEGNPNRPQSLINLAGALLTRFKQSGQMVDLEEAIRHDHAALALLPKDHTDRSKAHGNLAVALHARFKRLGKIEDLNKAIDCDHAALALRPQGHPDRPGCLNNLAMDLRSRFEQTGLTNEPTSISRRKEELNQIAGYFLEAEALLPPLHPMHAYLKMMIAGMNVQLYELDRDQVVFLHTACDLFAASVQHPTGAIEDRFGAAMAWSRTARLHNHRSVLHAYSACLSLLARLSVDSLNLDLQHMALSSADDTLKSLASDAASAAIQAGRIEMAVEMLEQGRAILWTKMREYRSPLSRLRETRPDLAEQFEGLSTRIERQAMSSQFDSYGLSSKVALPFEVQEREYRALSENWNKVVAEIRSVEGFQNFLQAVPFKAFGGLPQKVRTSPVLVPLPGASREGLEELTKHFATPDASSSENFSKNMTPILKELWKDVVQPVVEELEHSGVPHKSRIWWCPTSELCALPIHAAGPYSPKTKGLSDLYVSSYIPKITSLLTARSNTIRKSGIPKLLVVSEDDGGIRKLDQVDEEVRRIQHFGSFVDVLTGEKADRDMVIAELKTHPWVHFSCHGNQDPQPFHSFFSLYDAQRLKLLDLIKARLPDAEFAFVSACHGAAVDVKAAPDEVIHLSAALQFCGFRSVVGTLWAMSDVDGPDLAQDFYQHMFRNLGEVDFRDAATALNLATKEMRRRKVPLGRWVNFVHTGA